MTAPAWEEGPAGRRRSPSPLTFVRVATAAALAWTLALLGAAGLLLSAGGADVPALLALRPGAVSVVPPADPPAVLSGLLPIAPGETPWLRRLVRPVGSGGTGTVVQWEGRRFMVTAAHVVAIWPLSPWLTLAANPLPLSRVEEGGALAALPWGRLHRGWDLALYPAPDNAPALTVSERLPAVGEPARFAGYPLGEDRPWVAGGQINAVSVLPPGGGTLALTAAVEARTGQSGGALLDSEGRLIGIGVARTPWGVLAVGAGALLDALRTQDRLPTSAPPPRPLRLAVWALSAAAAVGLTLILDRGLAAAARGLTCLRGNVSP